MNFMTGFAQVSLDEDDGEERIFDPQDSRAHRHVPAAELIVYNLPEQVRKLRYMHPYTHRMSQEWDSIVLSIDGACRGNGTSSARGAWGVYFGPRSKHNASGVLDATLPQTSTRAEIEALSKALDIIRKDVSRNFSLTHYYIRTDSSYLVRTFSAWIQNWIDNGGRNSRGERAAHFDVLKKLHERLDDMTYGDDWGLTFKFWLVPREENLEADALANEALDTKPRVLSVSLHLERSFDRRYGSLLTKLRAGSTFQRVEDGQSAIRMLSGNQRPHAVLITDEALTLREHAHVWDGVLKYVRQGGTAVVMGHFPTFAYYSDINRFFAKAGLGWKAGSYTGTTLVLNRQVVGVHLASKLVPEYTQKALFVRNVKASDAWYVTDGISHVDSLLFSPNGAHRLGESPVLLARVGQGKLGYIGDVNGEKGSEAAVLAMCGL